MGDGMLVSVWSDLKWLIRMWELGCWSLHFCPHKSLFLLDILYTNPKWDVTLVEVVPLPVGVGVYLFVSRPLAFLTLIWPPYSLDIIKDNATYQLIYSNDIFVIEFNYKFLLSVKLYYVNGVDDVSSYRFANIIFL